MYKHRGILTQRTFTIFATNNVAFELQKIVSHKMMMFVYINEGGDY